MSGDGGFLLIQPVGRLYRTPEGHTGGVDGLDRAVVYATREEALGAAEGTEIVLHTSREPTEPEARWVMDRLHGAALSLDWRRTDDPAGGPSATRQPSQESASVEGGAQTQGTRPAKRNCPDCHGTGYWTGGTDFEHAGGPCPCTRRPQNEP